MADMLSLIPDMPDDALATLRGNAERLSRDGNEKQRSAAAAMLPAVLAELASRAQVRTEARRKKPRARKSAGASIPPSP